jgi:hypothetical protein
MAQRDKLSVNTLTISIFDEQFALLAAVSPFPVVFFYRPSFDSPFSDLPRQTSLFISIPGRSWMMSFSAQRRLSTTRRLDRPPRIPASAARLP